MVTEYTAKILVGGKIETFKTTNKDVFEKHVEALKKTFPNREVYLFSVVIPE